MYVINIYTVTKLSDLSCTCIELHYPFTDYSHDFPRFRYL